MIRTVTNLYPRSSNQLSPDSGLTVNDANYRGAYIAEMPVAGNLEAFAAYWGGGSGSRLASAECYSVSGGLPNSDLGATYDETSFSPGANSIAIATLDNALTLSSGDLIAFYLTNLNGTPASNYFSIGTLNNTNGCKGYGLQYDGTVWRYVGPNVVNLKISGSYYGSKQGRRMRNNLSSQPMYNDTGSPNTIRRIGFIYKPSQNEVLCQATLYFTKSGTVTGDWIAVEVWQGNTLVSTSVTKITSDEITATVATSAHAKAFYFSEIALSANTEYRIAARLVGADALDSSNYIMLVGSDSIGATAWPDDDKVTDGYLGGTYTTVETPTSSDWTDYRTSGTVVLPTVLLEGYLPMSGGGLLVSPGFNGGFN